MSRRRWVAGGAVAAVAYLASAVGFMTEAPMSTSVFTFLIATCLPAAAFAVGAVVWLAQPEPHNSLFDDRLDNTAAALIAAPIALVLTMFLASRIGIAVNIITTIGNACAGDGQCIGANPPEFLSYTTGSVTRPSTPRVDVTVNDSNVPPTPFSGTSVLAPAGIEPSSTLCITPEANVNVATASSAAILPRFSTDIHWPAAVNPDRLTHPSENIRVQASAIPSNFSTDRDVLHELHNAAATAAHAAPTLSTANHALSIPAPSVAPNATQPTPTQERVA